MEDVVGERADTRDDNNSSIFEIVGGEIEGEQFVENGKSYG